MYCPKCGTAYANGYVRCSHCGVALVSRSSKKSDSEELVTVFETGNPAELVVVKSILDSAHIPFLSQGEALQDLFGVGRIGAGFNPLIGRIKVQVAKRNRAKARELLKNLKKPTNNMA